MITQQTLHYVTQQQNAQIQAAAEKGHALTFSQEEYARNFNVEFAKRLRMLFTQPQKYHEMMQSAGLLNFNGVSVGVNAPVSATSGPGSAAAAPGPGMAAGPNAPPGNPMMNSASPHPSIGHPPNAGRATPAHLGNPNQPGTQGTTPGSTHHQTPPTTASSQHPSHTQGPVAGAAGPGAGGIPTTTAPGRASSLQPGQPIGQPNQTTMNQFQIPELQAQQMRMREMQSRAVEQARMSVPKRRQGLLNPQSFQGHGNPLQNPLQTPQAQELGINPLMYSTPPSVDLVARLNSYAEVICAYSQQRDRGMEYWVSFVDQYYSPTGDLRFGLKDPEAGSKKFEIAFPAIPRYYATQFRSGVERIQIMFENTSQTQHPDLFHTVEGKATIIYWYNNGCLYTAWTEVKAIFNAYNLIELLEFNTQENREFLPRDSIINLNSEGNESAVETATIKTENLNTGQSILKLPQSRVKQFGVPTDVMSFLETAETLLTMMPLFQYAQDHPNLNPNAALHELVGTYNNSQNMQQMQQQSAEQMQFQNQGQNQIMPPSESASVNSQSLGQPMSAVQSNAPSNMNPPFVSPGMMNLKVSAQNSPRLRGHPSATMTHASSPGGVPMLHQRSQQIGHASNPHAAGMSRSTSVGPGVIALGSPRVGGPMGAPGAAANITLAGNKRRRASAVAIPEENASAVPEVETTRIKASPRGAGGKKKS